MIKSLKILFSLTTDGWTKKLGEDIPYISLTLHFLDADDDYQMQASHIPLPTLLFSA